MKNKLHGLISFMLVVFVSTTGCGTSKLINPVQTRAQSGQTTSVGGAGTTITSPNVSDRKSSYSTSKYIIDAKLNTADKSLQASENIIYVNNEGVQLKEIYFHIYPNAYKSRDTIPVALEDYPIAYPHGFKPGFIEISKVTSQGKSLNYGISGKDNTILKITLDKAIKPGEYVEIDMSFKITLPPAEDRLGYSTSSINFGNWYPIAAVYDKTGWNLDPYYAVGDPFYSDVSDYEVKITVPKKYTVAATGEDTSEKVYGDYRIYDFKENSVRDFAWVASDKFRLRTATVDGIKVKSYTIDSDNYKSQLALDVAKNSIRIFNKTFGKYPYKNYSVVATGFITGMEYPGVVFINQDYYLKDMDEFYLEVTIAHETGHQWWYSTVGNNEVDEAWLDEGMTSYSEVVYYENMLGKSRGTQYFKSEFKDSYDSYRTRLNTDVILQPVSKFENMNDYALLVYYKGAIMLNALRDEVGDETFLKIVKTYYGRYKFKNATTDDFIGIVEEITGKQWDQFFNKWLLNK